MDFILSLWTAAPTLKAQLVVIAMVLQMAITLWCYVRMAGARVSAVKSGSVSPEMYTAVGDAEPEEVRVYTRLVANQFEMPVLFYAIMITGLAVGVTSWIAGALAFIFVFFRFQHAREMMGEHVVLRRRKIFIQATRVILLLMAELVISTIFFL